MEVLTFRKLSNIGKALVDSLETWKPKIRLTKWCFPGWSLRVKQRWTALF